MFVCNHSNHLVVKTTKLFLQCANQTRSWFPFPQLSPPGQLLQYADDTCITANSPAADQHLLDMVDRWLQWSGMRAKVPKCHCLALQGSTGKLHDPHLSITNQTIPFIGSNSIKFLGMSIQVPGDCQVQRGS